MEAHSSESPCLSLSKDHQILEQPLLKKKYSKLDFSLIISTVFVPITYSNLLCKLSNKSSLHILI